MLLVCADLWLLMRACCLCLFFVCLVVNRWFVDSVVMFVLYVYATCADAALKDLVLVGC